MNPAGATPICTVQYARCAQTSVGVLARLVYATDGASGQMNVQINKLRKPLVFHILLSPVP